MSVQANKDLVRRFFRSIEIGDVDQAASLIAENATWWVQGTGALDKPGVCNIHAGLVGATDSRRMAVVGEIGEGDRVAAEVEGTFRFRDGRTMDNTFHVAFILADGRIVAAKEYLDTAVVQAFSR